MYKYVNSLVNELNIGKPFNSSKGYEVSEDGLFILDWPFQTISII